ncbi:MAG: PIN domain-containing protein [Vicinamibacterales bacterium]
MPTVLDTHAWIWWVTEDRRLSRRAAQTIRRAAEANDATISAISIWEVARKLEKGQLVLDRRSATGSRARARSRGLSSPN